ncbi:hypothetical protein RUM43_001850 [Polyplax serrata]|uniref:Uncharacterized protein n=1 Tax=Polyplax serrata TaxID=468196 RepID=A0AAN8SEH0_POLSC
MKKTDYRRIAVRTPVVRVGGAEGTKNLHTDVKINWKGGNKLTVKHVGNQKRRNKKKTLQQEDEVTNNPDKLNL